MLSGNLEGMSEPVSLSGDDLHAATRQASLWEQAVRRAEQGETVAVIAHGDHVADVVPSGELDRLRETIEVLPDTELVRDLREGLAGARAGRVFSAGQVAADLAARRPADQTARLRGTRLRSPQRTGAGLARCRCPPRPRWMSS